MKNVKKLFSLKSIGLVLFAALALFLTNYAQASTPETGETVATASMIGLGAMNGDLWERGSQYFNWILDKNISKNGQPKERNDLKEQFLQDYVDGKKTIEAFTYYIRKKITQDGSAKLIESSDKNLEGICNMGEGKLGAGVLLVMTDIVLSYAESATDVQPDTLIYTNCIYDSTTKYSAGTVDLNSTETGNQFMPVAAQAIPTKFVNAELSLKNGNEVAISQMLVSDLLVNNRSGIATPNGGASLRVPKLIDGDNVTSAVIQFPKNGDIAENHSYVELKLSGIIVRNK